MHFPSCCSLQPPPLIPVPPPQFAAGFFTLFTHRIKGGFSTGSPQTLLRLPKSAVVSHCDTILPHLINGDPSSFLPIPPLSFEMPQTQLVFPTASTCTLFILFCVTLRCSHPSKAT